MRIAAQGGSAPPAARNFLVWQLRSPSRPRVPVRHSLLRSRHAEEEENTVRQHLDNSPDRWRIMVRRLTEAGPLEYAQLVDLVQAVGGGAGEAAEGEP